MVGATDQKTDWNLGETVTWIRTRDHGLVAAFEDALARDVGPAIEERGDPRPAAAAQGRRGRRPYRGDRLAGAQRTRCPDRPAQGREGSSSRQGRGRGHALPARRPGVRW